MPFLLCPKLSVDGIHLEIIIDRIQGKSAHADGQVYYMALEFEENLKNFNKKYVDALDNMSLEEFEVGSKLIFEEMNKFVNLYVNSLKEYKKSLGDRFIEYTLTRS